MNLENIREGELKEIFDILENAFKENDIDFYLIGAIARDIWYTMGGEEFRSTKDIDFAVLIGNRQDYQRVRDYLVNKGFTESSTNAFVIMAPSGLQIDLLPFGEMEIDEEVRFEGRGLTTIKVNGFMEVYELGTQDLTLETGHHFKIATLPSIVLLKFIAYDDRPELRFKDARDIINIVYHYFDLQSELIYEHHSDLFDEQSREVPLEIISATVIAREIGQIIANNDNLILRLQDIISAHLGQMEDSTLIRNMVNESGKDVEQVAAILETILQKIRVD